MIVLCLLTSDFPSENPHSQTRTFYTLNVRQHYEKHPTPIYNFEFDSVFKLCYSTQQNYGLGKNEFKWQC
jgi:hypothetical protein